MRIADSESIEQSIQRGVDWLGQQHEASTDGGWHPPTYGAMRGGASATSLALFVASTLPEPHRSLPMWKKGLEFLLRGLSQRDCIACPDGTLDYPTYSTALTLIASRRLGLPIESRVRRKLVEFLIAEQLTEANRAFSSDQVDYGGWDLLGGSGAVGFTAGSNISVSSFAVQALAAEEHPKCQATIKRALGWAQRCQNYSPGDPTKDGGFYFHPEKDALGNKAEWEDDGFKHPRSYGTPTCDGIRLMLAAGLKSTDGRVSSAIAWLKEQNDVKKVPGFEDASETLDWDEGLKYYFFMGLSQLLDLPNQPLEACRESLGEEIIDLQSSDGSWRNPSDRMREDDPHIATCFSLIALSNLVKGA
ncbi:MAG: prenyltransferase/squalene oxidase repeat-containing protein [Planctomycetota bacterium]